MSVNSTFDITVRYSGDATYQPVFDAAAQIWQQIITADIPDMTDPLYGFIDDLLIDASVVPIDGVGAILGQAGPDDFRSSAQGLLPDHGTMQFDSADVANMYSNGSLLDVILHEMGHILGIGTLWTAKGLKSGSNYTGVNALAEYRMLSGNPSGTGVPLETGGGSGTAGSHWSEATFDAELMTGYIDGSYNPISRMTIAALKDLGYTVDIGAADPYALLGHVAVDDFSGTSRTKGVLSVGAAATSASIEVTGDHDWYRVTLSAGTSYTIKIMGVLSGSGTLADPLLRLYDSTGRVIATDDDFGGSLDSLLTYTPSTSGTYYVGASAHGEQYTGTYKVSVANTVVAQPDLDALGLAVPNAAITIGASMTVNYTISNIGSAGASASSVGIYRSADTTFDSYDVLLTTRTIGPLGAGASASDSFALTLSTAGTYYLIAVADQSGQVAESNESNNPSNAVQVTVSSPQPDLAASSVALSNTTPSPGRSETVNYHIDNLGVGAAGSFSAGVYLSTGPTITTANTLLGHQVFGSLDAGISVSGSITVTLPSSLVRGTPYYIGVIADDANGVAESNESNNASSTVQIALHNLAPIVTSNGGGDSASVSIRENFTAVTTAAGSDLDAGTTLLYSIVGGMDAAKFEIDPTTGALRFILPPNYERPTDSDHNNSYVVQVAASDGSLSDTQTLTVTVNDSNDAALVVAAPVDFTHDGKSDLAWRHDGGDVVLWTMSGAQKVVDQVVSHMGIDWNLADAADFNGDGKTDILWRHDSGDVALWTMNGAQKVADQVVSHMGNDWKLQDTADFNGDGKADILWRHDSGDVALWTMNGAQKVGDQVVSHMGNDWHLIDTADFNGDHKTDILWRHDSGDVAVWTMNGAQKAADQVVSHMGNDWKFADTADFNGDGKADILWRHDDGDVALWTMNGGQKIADQVVSGMGNDWKFADTADFNGDGKADILWRNDSGDVAVWTMNGGQKVADQVVSGMGNDWHYLGTGDFNGDGKADILWRNDSGDVAVWTMNGGQKVADQVVSHMGHDWMFA